MANNSDSNMVFLITGLAVLFGLIVRLVVVSLFPKHRMLGDGLATFLGMIVAGLMAFVLVSTWVLTN